VAHAGSVSGRYLLFAVLAVGGWQGAGAGQPRWDLAPMTGPAHDERSAAHLVARWRPGKPPPPAPPRLPLQKSYYSRLEAAVMWLVGVCAVVAVAQLVALAFWEPPWRH
jgi:hypothetical protein